MIKKLRTKFIAISTVSVFLVLLVIMSCINILNYRQVINDSDEILTLLVENNGKFPKKYGNEQLKRDDFRKHINSPEMPYESRYFCVVVGQGGNILSTDIGRIAAVDADTAESYALRIVNSKRTHGFISNFRYISRDTEIGTMVIFLDCSRNLSNYRSFLFYSVLVSLLGLAAVTLLIIMLSDRIIKPMLESYEKQKAFITDAGHEIKTPLTIIDADLSILEMECGENEWTSDIRSQTKRLTELTHDLIFLSRMEEDNSTLNKIDMPLSDIIGETAQSFQSSAMVQEKDFTVDIQPMLSYCGDEKSIRQLISILLDNALKYSDRNGRISLSVVQKPKGICITVFNTAEFIDPSSLDRLFDRFYRTEQSHNSQTGGSGIGLSIAKAIVTAHGGKIYAESPDGRSLAMHVVLP